MTQAFKIALKRKDQAQQNYQLALGHEDSDIDVIDLILETQLAYIDAAHDANAGGVGIDG